MASISRPNVSSPVRFSGFLAEAPGSGRGSTNSAVTWSEPTVPAKEASSPFPVSVQVNRCGAAPGAIRRTVQAS